MKYRKSLRRALASGVLGAALVGLGSAAMAGASTESTVVVSGENLSSVTLNKSVRYGDLNLSTDAGRATLERRMRFAASDVCDGKNVSNTRTPIDYLDCYQTALRGAREQINQRIAAVQGGGISAVR